MVCYHSDDAFDKMDKDEMYISLKPLKDICHGDLRDATIEKSRNQLEHYLSQKKKLWLSENGVGCRWEISFQTLPSNSCSENIWVLMHKAINNFESYFFFWER